MRITRTRVTARIMMMVMTKVNVEAGFVCIHNPSKAEYYSIVHLYILIKQKMKYIAESTAMHDVIPVMQICS